MTQTSFLVPDFNNNISNKINRNVEHEFLLPPTLVVVHSVFAPKLQISDENSIHIHLFIVATKSSNVVYSRDGIPKPSLIAICSASSSQYRTFSFLSGMCANIYS